MLAHHCLAATVSYFSLEYQVSIVPTNSFCLSILFGRASTVVSFPNHSIYSTMEVGAFVPTKERIVYRNTCLPYSITFHTVFYLGLTEVSSIFLVCIDLAKYFPPTPDSKFDFIIGAICGPLFVITFFYYRVYMWWRVSFQLWSDALSALKSGMAEKMRPQKSFVLYIFLTINILLGVLQLYWFRVILGETAKVLAGEDMTIPAGSME